MNSKGLTLIEVVIAVAILSAALVGILNAFMAGVGININNLKTNVAVGLALEVIEEIKSKPFGQSLVPKPLPREFKEFRRSVETEEVAEDPDLMKVTVTVSKKDTKYAALTTVINKNILPPGE